MPKSWTPPANLIAPQGQTAPAQPNWISFLPADPNAVATGLTPQMLAQINGMGQPTPQAPAAPAAPSSYQQILNFFQQMGSGGGRGMGGYGMGTGGKQGGALTPFGRSVMASRNNYGLPKIPAPTAGAGGLVAPGDLTAYKAAQTAQDQQRDQLAKQMQQSARRQMLAGRGARRNSGGR